MASVNDLCIALKNKTGYETVHKYTDEDQIVLIGRLLGKPEDLLIVGHQLQVQALGKQWNHEIAKTYPLKGRKLVHAWRLVFEGPSIQDSISEIIQIITKCPKARRVELDSVELPGGSRYRNYEGKMGKGAAPIGQAKVGPAALFASMSGKGGR